MMQVSVNVNEKAELDRIKSEFKPYGVVVAQNWAQLNLMFFNRKQYSLFTSWLDRNGFNDYELVRGN